MTAAFVKILGTAHGLFALWILLSLPVIFKSGAFARISAVQASIKLTATSISVVMLFLATWFSWQLSIACAVFAWLALVAFILAAFSDTVALQGPARLFHLMPDFYKIVAVRAVAASLLTIAVFHLNGVAVGD